MKAPAVLLASILMLVPAVAEDRFGPDNPWFDEFAESCRDGEAMREDCDEGIRKAFASTLEVEWTDVSCNAAAFWAVVDERSDSDMFMTLPWQYAVEAIVAEPGICSVS